MVRRVWGGGGGDDGAPRVGTIFPGFDVLVVVRLCRTGSIVIFDES